MNIQQLIVKSSSRILKKIQYYGIANIKNILAITIIEDIKSFFKTDTTTDGATKNKFLTNLQHKFIHSDENIIKIQPRTDDLKDYRVPPIYDLEVTVSYLFNAYNVRIPSMKVFISEKTSEGICGSVGYTTTDDRGLALFRNLEYTKEYILWLETTDTYKYTDSVISIAKNSNREKKVKLTIGTILNNTETKEYSFKFILIDGLSITVPFARVKYIDSKGNYATSYSDQNGELALVDIPAGPFVYWINTPSGYVDDVKKYYVYVTDASDKTITLKRK